MDERVKKALPWAGGGVALLGVGGLVWHYAGISDNAKALPLLTRTPPGLRNGNLEVAVDGRVQLRHAAAERKLIELANYELVPDTSGVVPPGLQVPGTTTVLLQLVPKPNGGAAKWIANAGMAGWDVGLTGSTVCVQAMDPSRPPDVGVGALTPEGVGSALLVRGGNDRKVSIVTPNGPVKLVAMASVWPLPPLPSGLIVSATNRYVAKDLGPLTATEIFPEAVLTLREQTKAIRAINWDRVKKIEALKSLVHFKELTPELLASWQRNDGSFCGSTFMVAVGQAGYPDSPWPISPLWDTRAASLLWVDRTRAVPINASVRQGDTVFAAPDGTEGAVYLYPGIPTLSTMGEKFEDPWSSQFGGGKHYLGGEMDYLHDVPANARDRVDAMFKKCKLLGGRAAPSLDNALAAFDNAWGEYAKEVNAKKDEYAGYVLKAAALSGQPYLIAAATVFVAVMKILPVENIFGNKEEREASAASVSVMWTAMMKSATPSNGRVLQPTDAGTGNDMARVVNSRICAQLRNTLLPKEAILPLQAFWAMTMRAVPTNRETDDRSVPTVAAAYSALGGADVWSFLASDEQVVLVGLPIAFTYGLNGRRFCEMLWNMAQGWSRWPALLISGHDDVRSASANETHPVNAWSVQWFDLILTGFDLAERAMRGEIDLGVPGEGGQ